MFPNNLTEFDLFHPKSNLAAGTTPLIFSLTINIQDLPNRAPGDPYPALDVLLANAAAPGLYSVVGDHVGIVDISSVVVVNDPVIVGQPATATITLNFSKPLPDDRFTLTLSDHILDPAGNGLDGESDASEPGVPTFPSGNNVPGGDFVARFTVDTRPEIGTAVAQDIDIDINGNYYWDPANSQIGNDATNVDISFSMAVQNSNGFLAPGSFNVNDLLFVGRFTNSVLPPVPPGTAFPQRLYDQLGAYGYSSELSTQRWLIDINGDGVISLPAGGINVITPGNDIMTSQGTLSFSVAARFQSPATSMATLQMATKSACIMPEIGDWTARRHPKLLDSAKRSIQQWPYRQPHCWRLRRRWTRRPGGIQQQHVLHRLRQQRIYRRQ